MNKEFWLIKIKNGKRLCIDRVVCQTLRQAEKEFKNRNKSLSSCVIVKSEKWFE